MSHNDPLFVRYCDDMSHMCMTTIGHKDYGPRNIGQYNEEPDTVAIVFHQRMPGVSCDMDDFGDGNAKRLVACWNACAGMADPAAEIAALRAEVERLKSAAVPAPSQSADAEDAARGSHIRSNMWHDAGAYAQCGHCGRYSDNPKALLIDAWPCDCGMFHGWSGSFKRPTKESKWSDAAIDAARGGES